MFLAGIAFLLAWPPIYWAQGWYIDTPTIPDDGSRTFGEICFISCPVFSTLLVLAVWQFIDSLYLPEGLLYFAAKGNLRYARRALRNGVPVNCQDELGETALTLAAANGHVDVVKVLLLHGANPTLINGFGQTALEIAQSKNHQGVVAVLQKPDTHPKAVHYPAEIFWRPRPVRHLLAAALIGSLAMIVAVRYRHHWVHGRGHTQER
ncbi:MAG: ankyrin repeat domain-containing protein [Bdellovibrionales bacterium]